jgi:NADPH:quinone reductase-like Zn-dependent oxidoreductase
LLNQNAIKPPHIQTIDLEQAAQALMEMRKQRTVGKIVVMFPEAE